MLGLATRPGAASAASAQPGPGNTGVAGGTRLTAIYGNITVTKAGTVLNGLDVHGFIKVRAANVTIQNTRVHGSASASVSTGLIDAASAAVKNLVVQHCELTDDFPSIWVNGVVGHDYTARANNVHNVVDGFGVFNPSSPGSDVNVTIQGNWIHALTYLSPDRTHSDNHTHNDGVQIQGTGRSVGRQQVRIIGNTISALAGPLGNARSPYYPSVSGQAIAVTPNVSKVHDVVISGNWLDGGMQSVTMLASPKGTGRGLVLAFNRFGRQQYLHKAVRITPPVTLAQYGNAYADGQPITIATR